MGQNKDFGKQLVFMTGPLKRRNPAEGVAGLEDQF